MITDERSLPYDVFVVGLHRLLAGLERREGERGDRPFGDARRDCATAHRQASPDSGTRTALKWMLVRLMTG